MRGVDLEVQYNRHKGRGGTLDMYTLGSGGDRDSYEGEGGREGDVGKGSQPGWSSS